MRYRLKNQALQAALDKATNGAFGKGDVVRFRPWVGPDEEAVG